MGEYLKEFLKTCKRSPVKKDTICQTIYQGTTDCTESRGEMHVDLYVEGCHKMDGVDYWYDMSVGGFCNEGCTQCNVLDKPVPGQCYTWETVNTVAPRDMAVSSWSFSMEPCGKDGRGKMSGRGSKSGRGYGSMSGRGYMSGKGSMSGRGYMSGRGKMSGKGSMSGRGPMSGKGPMDGKGSMDKTGMDGKGSMDGMDKSGMDKPGMDKSGMDKTGTGGKRP